MSDLLKSSSKRENYSSLDDSIVEPTKMGPNIPATKTVKRSFKPLTPVILFIILGVLFWIGLNSGSAPLKGNIFTRGVVFDNWKIVVSHETATLIRYQLRLPRMVMALIIGMMLSSSGVVVQAVFRNPLADPYLIGISASAVTGAVLAYLLNLPDFYYGLFAFITSLLVTFIIFRLSIRQGQVNVAMLLIIGIAVSSFMGAFTSFAMYWIGEDSYKISVWLMGYLGSATWPRIVILIPPLFLSMAYFLYHRHDLDALLRGDEEAHSLGIDTGGLKKRLLAAASLIAAFSVAFSGMIGFVGLIVPHTVRLLLGAEHKTLLPVAAIGGGLFLLAADIIARTILMPVEIPIGIITAFFGAPFFLFLAARSKGGLNL